MSKILVISRKAPYGSSAPREALDLALAGALFDQSISILLLDDAVFQLLPGQHPKAIGQKNLGAIMQSLPIYDIDNIFIAERALKERGLTASTLSLPAKAISTAEIKQLIQEQDQVFHV